MAFPLIAPTAVTNGPNTIINTNSSIANTNSNNNSLKSSSTNEAHIPPLLGVAPLGPSPLQKEHQIQVSRTKKVGFMTNI